VWVRRVDVGPGTPQVAYAVGRRAGNAVTRNRIRRRLRSVIADQLDALRPASAYLVGADADAATLTPSELARVVRACLEGAP